MKTFLAIIGGLVVLAIIAGLIVYYREKDKAQGTPEFKRQQLLTKLKDEPKGVDAIKRMTDAEILDMYLFMTVFGFNMANAAAHDPALYSRLSVISTKYGIFT